MPWLLRRHQDQLHPSEIDLATDAARVFSRTHESESFPVFSAIASALTLDDATLAESAPETPKKPVSTEYHGVTVEDPYQWLEKDEDPQVKAWSDAQNQRTRKYLDSLPIGRRLKNN